MTNTRYTQVIADCNLLMAGERSEGRGMEYVEGGKHVVAMGLAGTAHDHPKKSLTKKP